MGDLQLEGLEMVNGVWHLAYAGRKLTFSNWAKITGIDRKTIKERARLRWPVGQILGYEERVKPEIDYEARRRRQIPCNGRTQSIAKWSEERNLSPSRIAMRIANGWTIEQALGFVPRERKQKPRPNQLTAFSGLTIVIKTIEMVDRKAIGKQAREVRTKAGKTLREASEALGMTLSGLDHLEIGRRDWTPELMERFNRVAAGWVVQNG